MTTSELTALVIDRQDRCIEHVYSLVGEIITDGIDVSAAALQVRCMAAMARVMRPTFAFHAEVMAKEASVRSRELGQAHPFEPLPVYFEGEAEPQAEFHRGQQSAWGTQARAANPKDTGALVVKEIRVRGTVAHSEYDEHPDLAFYWTTEDWDAVGLARDRAFVAVTLEDGSGSQRLERLAAELEAGLNQGLALPQAKHLAQALRMQVRAVEDLQRTPRDGQFTSHSVLLLDQHGEVLQKLTGQGWLQPVPRQMWARLLQQAAAKESEASIEASWDNFETAKRLRGEARDIRELVALSQRLPRAPMATDTPAAG